MLCVKNWRVMVNIILLGDVKAQDQYSNRVNAGDGVRYDFSGEVSFVISDYKFIHILPKAILF